MQAKCSKSLAETACAKACSAGVFFCRAVLPYPDPMPQELNLPHQIELAHFPADVQVSHEQSSEGVLLRAEQDGRGLELWVTDEAFKMYGAGPAVTMALTHLKQAAEAGLPEKEEGGTYHRAVFLGD